MSPWTWNWAAFVAPPRKGGDPAGAAQAQALDSAKIMQAFGATWPASPYFRFGAPGQLPVENAGRSVRLQTPLLSVAGGAS